MKFMLPVSIPPLQPPIGYTHNILLIGSCFTEHIADRLLQHRFHVLSNPHGILFNPLSVAASLDGYIDGKTYTADDLFYLNELWNSWDHHTRFSNIEQATALQDINSSQAAAAAFIHRADWLIITLGSAFQYYLIESDKPVANNHRAPAQWFEKRLLDIPEITAALQFTMDKLATLNPTVRVMFTISPVRHIRDGVVDNNRSKARLIDAVHELCSRNSNAVYFPAYELVIDVLRDYRYYDIDMVHPNYLGTAFVWEQFVKACIVPEDIPIMEQVQEIMTARSHRPRFPGTEAHRNFLQSYAAKVRALGEKYPFLDLGELEDYFLGNAD